MDNRIYIKKMADRVIHSTDTGAYMGMTDFDWVQGVGLYGILLAYRATGDQRYIDYAEDWCDTYLERYYEKRTVNTTVPFLTAIELCQILKTDKYKAICTDVAEYLLNDAPKTLRGGLEHTVIQPVPAFREQLWADTLFMAGLFLLRMGRYEEKFTGFAVEQFILHNQLLFDEKNGLYFHGYSCLRNDHLSGIHWGRANAWVILSNSYLIELLGDFKEKNMICGYIRKHAEGLLQVLREDGSFGTILDDSTSYSETSATAGIAAGMKKAVELGILGDEYRQAYDRMMQFIIHKISSDGTVEGVSEGTPIMESAEGYRTIQVSSALYGQSLAIAAML